MTDIANPTREGSEAGEEGSEAGERICWKCGETYGSHLQYCPEDGAQLVELDPSDEGDLLVGTVFDDRFRIMSVLGEGGMSRVYHARQIDGEKPVALKILKADFLRDEEIRKRFMYEARVIAGLDHEAAVGLHDFGQAPDGSFYMVMELLEGESLANRLRRRFITYRELFAFVIPTCGVMAEAHRNDVIHRDLKPENIYLTHLEQAVDDPKLLDFGIAKHLRMGTMTQSDARWGTPAYMSPEQASGDPVQGTADVYALGVMLYELVAGVLPFRASTAMGFAVKHMHKDARPIRELPGMSEVVPAELDELILEMIAKEAADRPKTMEEVQRRLEAVRDSDHMASLLETTPGESLNRDQIELEPEDAGGSSGADSGGVQVNEELKSAHTVFVEDENQTGDVQGEHVASLDQVGPMSTTGNLPTPASVEASATATGEFETPTDTDELALGSENQSPAYWWLGGAAVLVGAGIAWMVSSQWMASTSGEGTTPSQAMIVETDAAREGRESQSMGAGEPKASEAVGKSAAVAARITFRARSVARAVDREVEAMPTPDADRPSGGGAKPGESPSARGAGSQARQTSGKRGGEPTEDNAGGEAQSDKEDEPSEESVREALETTF